MGEDGSFKVICINTGNSIQLFKGHEYICNRVYQSSFTGSNDWYLHIKGGSGEFPIGNFTLLDGSSISTQSFQIPYHSVRITSGNREDLIGMKIICDNYNLKTIIGGKLYHIEDVRYYRSHITGIASNNIDKIQLKENGKWYSNYNFKKLPISVSRELDIDSILDNENAILNELTTYERKKVGKSEEIYKLISSVLDAMNYKKKMGIDNISLTEIIEKRALSKHNIKINDFSKLNDIDWIDLINSNKF